MKCTHRWNIESSPENGYYKAYCPLCEDRAEFPCNIESYRFTKPTLVSKFWTAVEKSPLGLTKTTT